MDIEKLVARTREYAVQGLVPSERVRALFREFGEFSAVYLIQCFSMAYGAFGGDIGHLFAAWWPDAPDSISGRDFNEGLRTAIERSVRKH